MRNCLYRGKRTANGEWLYGKVVDDDKDCFMYTFGGFVYTVDPDTVSEFIGLRDRNGKRIFEGDIINYEDGDPSDYEYHDGTIMNVGEIIFCDGKFCFTNAVSVTMDDLLCENNMLDCEVIGNKWDGIVNNEQA